MRGQILNFDAATGFGQISADDGSRYTFRREHLRQQVTPWSGAAVDFVPQGSDAVDIFVLNNAAAHSYSGVATPQNDWGKLFFSAEGRITRSRFWAGWGILFGVGIIASFIPFAGFLLIWSNICVTSKRLHDMGRTGWWQVLPYGLALVLVIVGIVAIAGIGGAGGASSPPTDAQSTAIGLSVLGLIGVYLLSNLGFLVWVGATPSDPHENRFGPPPGQNLATTFD